jgi:CheY-like chemotaxis protein
MPSLVVRSDSGSSRNSRVCVSKVSGITARAVRRGIGALDRPTHARRHDERRAEALEVSHEPVDLAIIDIGLPDADGIEGAARGPEDTPFAIISFGGVMLLASLAGMAIMALVIWLLRWW